MHATELCVIFNPAAGRRRAGKRLEALKTRWRTQVTFWPTERAGHAEELARRTAEAGFGTVAAAGGDGTVHEVANGLLSTHRPDVFFAVVPLGSANDYANALEHEFGSTAAERGSHCDVDVGLVRDESGRERFFVGCLGLGLNGLISLEARKIRRLQGLALYGLATLRAVRRHRESPVMTLAIDERAPLVGPNLMLSVLVGRREGNFVMAPGAKLGDGWFDYVRTGHLTRLQILGFLPGLAFRGPPADHPAVETGRCRRIKLRSETPLVVHVDGEIFCAPETRMHALEIEVQPRGLRVRWPLCCENEAP